MGSMSRRRMKPGRPGLATKTYKSWPYISKAARSAGMYPNVTRTAASRPGSAGDTLAAGVRSDHQVLRSLPVRLRPRLQPHVEEQPRHHRAERGLHLRRPEPTGELP